MEHVTSCKAKLPLWTAPAPRILTDYVATIFHLVAQENHALMKKTGNTQKDKLEWTILCLKYPEYKEGIYWTMTPIYGELMFRFSRWSYSLKQKFGQGYL